MIVGAGVGGCASAALLSSAGHSVTVFERQDRIGGRCSTFRKGRYRFDLGASMLMMLDTIKELETLLGRRVFRDGEVLQCDPNCVVRSGSRTLVSSVQMPSLPTSKREAFRQFQKDGERHYRAAKDVILRQSYDSLRDAITWSNVTLVLGKLNLRPLYSYVSNLFQDEFLSKVFSFQSMYMGTSPYDALAAYNLLQWSEMEHGIFYPRGGMGELPKRLASIAQENQAEIVLDCGVTGFCWSASNKQTITGVTLETGESISCDLVVCNADRTWASENLLPHDEEATTALHEMEHGCSTISFYWGLDTDFNMPSHQILLGTDYSKAFEEIFQHRAIPTDPSLYVHAPSTTDPSACPKGHSVVIVLLPVGCDRVSAEELASARSLILSRMSDHGYDLSKHIVEEHVETPNTWCDQWHVGKGQCLGLNHSLYQMGPFRPSNRHRSTKNLYFVGASVQPGGGVPIVLHSAMNVCRRILNEPDTRPSWLHWIRLRPLGRVAKHLLRLYQSVASS